MCGGQRMVVALFHGEVVEAFWYNPFLFVAAPCLALWCWWTGGLSPRAAMVLLALMLAWGVLRNIVPMGV